MILWLLVDGVGGCCLSLSLSLSIVKRYLQLLFGFSLPSPLFLSQFELGFCCLLIVVLGCCLLAAWSAWWQQPHIVVIGQFYKQAYTVVIGGCLVSVGVL